jgi:hypothetical protein
MAAVGGAQLQLDFLHRVFGKLARVGQQDCGRIGSVLRLPEQVGRAHLCVAGVVRDHQGLGRTGEQVDAHAAGQLALGFGDEGIARARDHVGGLDRGRAERHGTDRLHAADRIYLVRAAQVHGGDDRGMGLALVGRRTGDDAFHAGDARGDDAHVRRRDERVFAAGHVTADAVDRDVLVPEHHARQRFDFHVTQRIPLDLREVADLLLRELDVLDHLFGQRAHAVLDLALGHAETLRGPAVELGREIAHRVVAALLDIGKNVFDGLAHLGDVRRPVRQICRFQKMAVIRFRDGFDGVRRRQPAKRTAILPVGVERTRAAR